MSAERQWSDADLDALADRIAERLRKVAPATEPPPERLPITQDRLKRVADKMARPRKIRMR